MARVFDHLQLWCDPLIRSGPDNMAVDEWLHETVVQPVLRIYRWEAGWGSLGYFGGIGAARRDFPDLRWVRRWTGGGTVDHRADWTYTLAIPAGHPLAGARGAESYRVVHAALAEILPAEGIPACLSGGDRETSASACFANPVLHDLVDSSGVNKLAGAGQRRSRYGLLHQGSVAAPLPWEASRARGSRLAAVLGADFSAFAPVPCNDEIARRAVHYRDGAWTGRR